MPDSLAELRALLGESSAPPVHSSFDELQRLIAEPSTPRRADATPTPDELEVVARAPKLPGPWKPAAPPVPSAPSLIESRTPAADLGLTDPIEGAKQAVTGVAGLARGIRRPITEGSATPLADLARPEMMGAASDVIEGTMRAGVPAMVASGIAAPIETLTALVGGAGAQHATAKVAEMAGASPEAQRLAGNVGAIVGGGAAAHIGARVRPRMMEALKPSAELPPPVSEEPVGQAFRPAPAAGPLEELQTLVDEGGRELGGYAGPERRVAAPAEALPPEGVAERRLPADQVRADLRENPDLVRQADEMKRRTEAARHDTPIDELRDLVGEVNSPNAESHTDIDQLQTGAQAERGLDREAAADDVGAARRRNAATSWAGEEVLAASHPEARGVPSAQRDVPLEDQERLEVLEALLGSDDADRAAVRTSGSDVEALGSTAPEIGARPPQERGRTGQPTGELRTPERLGPPQTTQSPIEELRRIVEGGDRALPLEIANESSVRRVPGPGDAAQGADLGTRNVEPEAVAGARQEAEAPFSAQAESTPTADAAPVGSTRTTDLSKPKFGEWQQRQGKGDVTLQATIIPGAKEFAEKDVIPTMKVAGETIARAADDIQRTFAAASRGEAAQTTAGIIRARAAELAHRTARAEHALSTFGKMFDRRPPEQNFKFIDDIEHGSKTDVAEFAPVQKALRAMLDNRRREVQARGRLNQVIADYFPHIWKDPDKAGSWLRSLFGRKPLQGPKSFLKQRSIGTTAQGRAMGLEPASNNPVTLTLLKVREMDKWITGHDALEDMKAAGVAKYVPVGTEAPEGSVRINDPIGTVYGNPNVPVHEAFDESLFKGLNALAKDLGVTHERSTKLKGGPRNAWGLSHEGASKIQTRTGGPEQVIAHEIGHQIDDKFGLWRRIHKEAAAYKAQGYEDWNVNKELRALTDLTWEGKEVPQSFKEYVRKKEEKIANMVEAYVHVPAEFKRVAPNIFNVFDELVDTTPVLQQLRDIKPSMRLSTREDTTRIGGMVVNGHWWAPAEAAQVLNQHLSPGLAGNALFDVYRGAGNLVTQAKFALSAFHALFEASESVLSKAALSLQYATPKRLGGAGEPLTAAKKAGEILVAPFTDYFRGAKALREYFTKDPIGQVEGSMVDQIIQGGGRVKWDDFYKSNMAKGFVEAVREGNYPGALLRAPFATMEALAHPIMGHLVPRLKIGAYLDLARYEVGKLPKEATQAETQAALGRAWDSIDNRFGELVYDNLFWPRWVKDTGQVTFRALGWNAGTVREVGGAARDTAKFARSLMGGQTPDLTPKMAYGLALAGVGVMFQGTVMQYLMTGEKPRDLKDMIFPRTGRKTPTGHDERLKLWTYAGDLYEVAHHPTSTVKNKLHDMLTALVELAENRDWKGVQIHDPEAPVGEQAAQVGRYALEKIEPISMSNARRAKDAGRSGITSYVGVGTAPAWLSQSKAEQMVYDFTKSDDTRTLKQEASRQTRQDLRQAVRGGETDKAREIAQRGELGRKSIQATARTARLTALQSGFRKLTLDQALKVYEAATPEERGSLRPWLSRKAMSLRDAAPDAIPGLQQRLRTAGQLPAGPPPIMSALQPNQ